MLSAPANELRAFLQRLDAAIDRDDLAGLVVHLNDTYLAEERRRPPEGAALDAAGELVLPGLARIARLTRWLRRYLIRRIGNDRLLVVHSGDLLAPSYLSNTLETKGEHMVQALNACGLDYATLGNHELDFGPEPLLRRVAEARFPFVLSNFTAPPDGGPFLPHASWPDEHPWLAILGFGGADVAKKVDELGYRPEPLAAALRRHLDRIAADERVRALLVLSHMDRSEDHELVDELRRRWPRSCCAYILGGHDHDMDWFEFGSNVVFSKNFANCRTVTLVPITKSVLMVPTVLRQRYLSREREIELMTHDPSADVDLDELFESDDPAALLRAAEEAHERVRSLRYPTTALAVRGALRAFARSTPQSAPRDFKRAYARLIVEAAARRDPLALRRDAYEGKSEADVNGDANQEAQHDWNRPIVLGADGSLLRLREDRQAREGLAPWLAQRDAARGPDAARVVKRFDLAAGTRLEATEAALRSRSTDFGNFVADAVRGASGADVAVLHAGCFRADETFEPTLTRADLLETFLYDRPTALRLVHLGAEELLACYGHAAASVGKGAFLQVSASTEDLRRRTGLLRVAICDFLLDPKSSDGYVDILARLRGGTPEAVMAAIRTEGPVLGRIVDLVSRGAAGVDYSVEPRLVAAKEAAVAPHERDARVLLAALQAYAGVAREAGRDFATMCLDLEDSSGLEPPPQKVDAARRAVWRTVHEVMRRRERLRLDAEVMRAVVRSRASRVDKIEYGTLLDKAWGMVNQALVAAWHRHRQP